MSAAALTTSFFTPHDDAGDPVEAIGGDATFGENNRGVFRLAAGTYYYHVAHADASVVHVQLVGNDEVAITSATLEECSFAPTEAPLESEEVAQWFPVAIGRIDSAKTGTGWTNTSDVGANAAGNAGGVSWSVIDQAARRMRLKVVIATEGNVRVTGWGRE